MVLKTETIKIGDKEIKIHELTCAGQFRLLSKQTEKTLKLEDSYIECVEDKNILEQLTPAEGIELMQKINVLNGWTTKEKKKTT